MDEHRIIKEIARKNEKAFRELYECTSRKTYHYLLRMLRDPRKAEDVMVDTYAEVWKSASKFRGDSRLSTWIIGIARHLALKEFGKKKLSTNSLEDYAHAIPATTTTIDTFIKRDLLVKAMDKLSNDHREILDLVFFHEMSYKEISKILGIPVNTVKTRVFYAKENLKSILERMGIDKNDVESR